MFSTHFHCFVGFSFPNGFPLVCIDFHGFWTLILDLRVQSAPNPPHTPVQLCTATHTRGYIYPHTPLHLYEQGERQESLPSFLYNDFRGGMSSIDMLLMSLGVFVDFWSRLNPKASMFGVDSVGWTRLFDMQVQNCFEKKEPKQIYNEN